MDGHVYSSLMLCAGLFLAMLALLFVLIKKNVQAPPREAEMSETMKLTMNSTIALLGLLIAFTFSNSYSRLLLRRQLIVDEANAIGTAYLRLDLASATERPALKDLFRSYLDLRTRYYSDVDTAAALDANLANLQTLQKDIWNAALKGTEGPSGDTPRRLLLPALNTMFDITTDRAVALQTHMPGIILVMLIFLPLICAYMLGHNSYRWRQFFYAGAFSFVVCFVLYVIMDIDHPRRGFVRLDHAERQLEKLSNLMKEEAVK